MKTKLHVTIISRSLPPMVIGTPIILHNLFSEFKGRLSAIGGWQTGAKIDPEFSLNTKEVFYFKSSIQLVQRFLQGRFKYHTLFFLKAFIKRKLKTLKPDIVFATIPDPIYLVASYLCCKELDLPLIIHIHDLWMENAQSKTALKFAQKWEPLIYQNADLFCVTTLAQQQLYADKYDIESVYLPHTIKDEFLDFSQQKLSKEQRNKIVITYTGNVSRSLNLDALQIFIQALNFLPKQYYFRLFTSLSKDQLKEKNLYHERVSLAWVNKKDVIEELRNSDLLYLPLSFDEKNRKEIETVFATKTLDYLVSGTPILLHTPHYSYHKKLVESDEWALLSEAQEPQKLASQIIEFMENKTLKMSFKNNMRNEAEKRRASSNAENLIFKIRHVLDAQ